MSKMFDELKRALSEVDAHLKGEPVPGLVAHLPPDLDARAIRARLGQTQAEFAARIGVSKRTLENWEQGRRLPQGPARVLLALLAKDPDVVSKLLAAE